MVRRGQQGPARRGQPRLRDTALDDVPGRGVGLARARREPMSRYREEPQEQRRPDSSTRTSWPVLGARSTPARPNGPRPSPPSGYWRSPDAAAAKCSICAGATSGPRPSTFRIPRPARAPRRSARPRARSSRRCPDPATRMRSCSRATPKAGAPTASQRPGGRSAPMRNSDTCACMIYATPPPARPSCRARICPWSASCSGTEGTAPRRGYAHLADGHLAEAAETVGALIGQAMDIAWEAKST